MSILLYSMPGCYPCDRVKTTLINAKLPFKVTEAGSIVGIQHYPTLCLLDDNGHEVARLVGPNNITEEKIRKLSHKYNITID